MKIPRTHARARIRVAHAELAGSAAFQRATRTNKDGEISDELQRTCIPHTCVCIGGGVGEGRAESEKKDEPSARSWYICIDSRAVTSRERGEEREREGGEEAKREGEAFVSVGQLRRRVIERDG